MLRLFGQRRKWLLAASCAGILITVAFIYNQYVNRSPRVGEAEFLIEELSAVLDAARQYSNDNGSLPPITSDTNIEFGYVNINNLIENPNLPTWQGPYLDYDDTWIGGAQYIEHPDYIATQLLLKEKDSQWVRGSTDTGCKSTSSACSLAACIWLVPETVAQEINHKVDGELSREDSDATGKVRYDNAIGGSLVCMVGDDYPMPSTQLN